MSHRPIDQDQETCPVSERFFKSIVGASLATARDLALGLPEDQRSRLAVFCYRRAHLRRLGLTIAATCPKRTLVEEAGHAGELIYLQAQNLGAPVAGDRYMASRHVKRPVSLHNC